MAAADGRTEEMLRTAEGHLQKGDRNKALDVLRKALKKDPGNEKIQEQITAIEREIAAMRSFKQTRSRRSHSPERTVPTGTDFVDECLERSREAFNEGDEVRALQELERAKRHDPDNRKVQRQIQVVRRSIKASNLYDLAIARLRSGDIPAALEQARKIFAFWPSAPALEKLLDEVEGHTEHPVIEEPEEIDIEEIEELEEIEEKEEAPEPAISPSEVVVTSIREKIARSSFAEALQEAREGIRKFPDNETLQKLLDKLEKIAGEPEPAPVPARGRKGRKEAAPPEEKPKEKPKERPEEKPEERKAAAAPAKPAARPAPAEKKEKKKLPLGLIIGIAAVVVLALVVVVINPFGGGGDDTDVVVEPVDQPYSVAFTVEGPPDATVTVDGTEVSRNPDGTYQMSGTGDETRQIRVSAEGYETRTLTYDATGGADSQESITLDTLGTSTVQVTFEARMPEGEPQPEEGAVTWLVDGEEIEEMPVSLATGLHVFQAVLDGYNSIPESVLVDYTGDVSIQPLALLSQEESQISLSLAGDITGYANFYIDGTLVGSGVRRITEVVPHGSHTLRITMDEYEDWYRTIDLGADGYSNTVTPVSLVTTGRLLIGPEPWAEVFIDGSSYGQTPMPPIELEEGTYSVRLTNPEYEDQTSSVTITAGEDTSIRYTADAVEAMPDTVAVIEEPVIPPFPVQQVSPVTPGIAMEHGDLHGYVTLQVMVGTDGSVRDVTILSDELGLGCGQAAVDAAWQWVWNPATQGGVAVEVPTTIQMRFDIE
jgi:tetratricopeptide (TPR) repeat protein